MNALLTVVLVIVGMLVAVVAVLAFLFVFGIRRKWGFVLRRLFAMQRSFMNPTTLRTAGTEDGKQGVIRHRGRTSGRDYQTPVDVAETADSFVVALPYGSQTNWVRNVIAAGSAGVTNRGRTWTADRPEIVPLPDVAELFSAGDRRVFRVFGLHECLRLRKAGPAPLG